MWPSWFPLMPVETAAPRPATEDGQWSEGMYLWHVVDVLRIAPERLWSIALDPDTGIPCWDEDGLARRAWPCLAVPGGRCWHDGRMGDMRRRRPERPPGPPQVQIKPGLAQEMLAELAPLLAEEGIDVEDIDVPDLETLHAAMSRAVERANMARFTPVGAARELAVAVLRRVVEAVDGGDTRLAAAILDEVQPESPDNTVATVAGCIGIALGLLDDWFGGGDPQGPPELGQHMRLPAGHWMGERAATDILALARKGRAFSSLDTLIVTQGGQSVLYGAALTLAAAIQNWSAITGTPVADQARTAVR